MILKRLDLRAQTLDPAQLRDAMPRATTTGADVAQTVRSLLDDVRARGESALLEQAERFDGVSLTTVRVASERITEAVVGLDPALRASIELAIGRVRQGSLAQIPPRVETEVAPGARIVQRWRPVGRVGVYVPGGKAVYPSSVVMNVVPAQAAGVGQIALVSPPQREFDGGVHPAILAAAGLLGVDEVYATGGAGAIGALAYGVPEAGLAPVDVITGPGNRFVATAKGLVKHVCGIDAEAGPTEIMIVADRTAHPAYVAADLLSQAEHDELAGSVLVTDDEALLAAVERELEARLARTANRERAATALAGNQSAAILVRDADQAIEVANAYGAEHLELMLTDAQAAAERIDNAGAIFLGDTSPVSLGDYVAGSNHVLPTGGTARFSSALGSYSFLRAQQVIEYERRALGEVADRIVDYANAERLPAHGEAVSARFEEGE